VGSVLCVRGAAIRRAVSGTKLTQNKAERRSASGDKLILDELKRLTASGDKLTLNKLERHAGATSLRTLKKLVRAIESRVGVITLRIEEKEKLIIRNGRRRIQEGSRRIKPRDAQPRSRPCPVGLLNHRLMKLNKFI